MVYEISQSQKVRCEIKPSLRNRHFAAKSFRSLMPFSTKIFTAAKLALSTRVPLRSTVTSFRSYEMATKSQSVKTPNFAAKAPFRMVFRSCETTLWHTSAISQHSDRIWHSCEIGCENGPLLRKSPSVAKSTLICENQSDPWYPFIFYKNQSFELRKGTREEENQSNNSSALSPEPKPRVSPAISSGHFLRSAMARTRGAKSSSPSSRKRAEREAPVQGSISKPL